MSRAGNATFASCDKAGSIPYFTEYLLSHPGDFDTLKWRARANSIIGNRLEAISDFRIAERYNGPPRNLLVRSEIAFLEGNVQQGIGILQDITKQYPACGEAWADLGSRLYHGGDHENASEMLLKAVEIGNLNGEEEKPWHYWSKDALGEFFFLKGNIDASEQYYNSAIQYCPSFTKAFLGVGRCSVIKGDLTQADCCYRKARELNPSITPWETFGEFKGYVESKFMPESNIVSQKNPVLNELTNEFAMMSASYSKSQRNSGGGFSRGGGGRRGGNRNGDGSSSDDDSDGSIWKKFKATKPTIKKSVVSSKTFMQVGDSKYWLSRDKAGYAGSYFKLFVEKGNTLDFVGSVPITIFKEDVYRNRRLLKSVLENDAELCHFDLMTNKRESHAGEQVKKKDLSFVQIKPKKRD